MKEYRINISADEGFKYQRIRYPAGETQIRLLPNQLEAIADASKLLVTFKFWNHDGLMDLALLSDALFDNGNFVNGATLKMDYLPYSRADRRFTDGDTFGLKVFGRIICGLGYTEVETIDVHSSIARKYMPPLKNIDPLPYIGYAIEDIGKKDLTILLPDKGAHRYNLGSLKMPILQADKKRDAVTGVLTGFEVPHIKTKKVLIVDDICDGGGTFIGIADQIWPTDTQKYLYVTHGIFSKGLVQLKQRFKKIFTYQGEV